MPGKTIKIISDQKNGNTPVYINGIGRDIPHNKNVAVTDAELEVLENSGVYYETVGAASAKAVKAAAEEASNEPSVTNQQKPGGDNLTVDEPDGGLAVVTPAPEIDQEPGGDNLTGSVIHGASPAANDEQARADAKERAEAAREGTIEPTVVLRNTDPDMLGLDANNPDEHGDEEVPLADAVGTAEARRRPLDRDANGEDGGSISIARLLGGTVGEVLAKLDSLDSQQRAELKKLEKAGKNRSGILNNL